ncbi:Leu/Ile/Val-binding protein [subsurface metagenome]
MSTEVKVQKEGFKMRYDKIMWLMAILLGVILLMAGFGSQILAESRVGEDVLIGVMYPLSGPQAPTGHDLKNGVELAVEIINESYPNLNLTLAKENGLPNLSGAKIKVIYSDHQGSPEKGMSEAERLYVDKKVVAIVGCYNSGVTATASQIAERLQMPFLNPDSVSPTLIERGFKWFFRLTPDDKMFTENMFKFLNDLEKEHGEKVTKLAIINENTLWGQDFAGVALKLAQDKGFTVVEHIVYPSNTPEVTAEVQRIKIANPDVILQASYVSDAILFMETFKEQEYAPRGLLANAAGFVDAAFTQILGKDSDFIITRSVWSKDLLDTKPVAKEINEIYKAKYGVNMNENSARSFMGMLVLADSLNRAGSSEPNDIRKAILATEIPAEQIILAWEGIKFDLRNGQNVLGRAVMVQIKDGEYNTIWPFNLAKEKLVWPFPTWSSR